MPSGTSDDYRAIFFLQDHRVTRQMRFKEFEAFLDGYIGLSDTLDQEVRAVYAVLTPEVKASALVFFKIYFDDQGCADPEWNVPLDKLIAKAASGPDLGAGPIRLVCRGRCPDSAYLEDLWDPAMQPGQNDITVVRKAVEENRIGFERVVPEVNIPLLTDAAAMPAMSAVAVLSNGMPADQRLRTARLLKEQRLRIKTLQSQHEDEMAEAKRQLRLEVQTIRREAEEARQKSEQLAVSNENLKRRLNDRSEQFEELQELLADKDRILASLEGEQEDRVANDPLKAEMVILREQIERLEADIARRQQVERDLQNQLALAREDAAHQMASNVLISKLRQMGIFLVSFHPGAGHLTIPYDVLEEYLANPLSFAAEKCKVDLERYKRWLEHYENPVCGCRVGDKDCGAPVMRVSSPADFRTGIDDRCDEHRP